MFTIREFPGVERAVLRNPFIYRERRPIHVPKEFGSTPVTGGNPRSEGIANQ